MSLAFRYQSIRNGLVGHWRPSRGPTGNTLLDSVRGNHGTLVNGPTWQANGSGLALSFDGTDDYVELPSATPNPTQLSISAWLNPIALVDTRTLLGYDGGSTAPIRLAAKTSGTVGAQGFYFGVGATSIFLNNTAIVNRFSHLVGIVGNEGIALYINGILAASNVTPTSVIYGSFGNQRWTIGRNNGGYFQSQCDDWSIFNRTLTPSEILTLYTAGRGALDQRVNVPVVRGYVASGGAYTLTADVASFTLAGQSATLVANRKITSDQASFALTGQSLDLLARRVVQADNAAFALAGQEANLLQSHVLSCDNATFAGSYQDASIIAARLLTGDQASYALSWQDATITPSSFSPTYTLSCDQASFTTAYQNANLFVSRLLTADQTSFTFAGQDATLSYSGQSEAPFLELDFASGNRTTGTLAAIQASSTFTTIQATGTLEVIEAES